MAYKLRPRFKSSGSIYADKYCQLSNDPPENGEIHELTLCNIQQYRCRREEDAEELLISYQYELFISQDAVDHNLVRQYLEEAMLEQLASRTGTIECNEVGRVLGVSRAPIDVVDSRFNNCVTPPMEGAVCVPMLGGSTISLLPSGNLTANNDNGLHSALMNFIRSEMENDVYVRPGSIEKVVFVNRTVSVTDVQGADIQAKPSALAVGEKAGIATGATLFFLLLLVVGALVAKPNRRQARILEEPDDDEFTLGDGSLAMKDSLALKPREVVSAQTPPRKEVLKDAVVMKTPETPESDISFEETPKEKQVQSGGSPTSIMANADADRHSASVMAFAVSKSESAEEVSTPKYRVVPSPSDVDAQIAFEISPLLPISDLLAPTFSEDTVSDIDQGCCM